MKGVVISSGFFKNYYYLLEKDFDIFPMSLYKYPFINL